jgi:hypothetical protein
MLPAFLEWPMQSVDSLQREPITEFLHRHPHSLSGYTYASLISWDPIFQYGLSFADSETLIISCLLSPDGNRHLMQPLGSFLQIAQDSMVRAAGALPYPLKIVGVGHEFLGRHADFAARFAVVEDPAAANYIYRADDLARLPGRKYAKKRNLLSQAQGLYRWDPEPLAGGNAGACAEVLRSIQEQENPESDANLEQELAAIDCTLSRWEDLGQQGILLRIGGRPAAFSIFERISADTVAVHFERALRSYKGLYQVINWEAAKAIAAQGFAFINREEDLGSPGLRDAKRSYAPIKLMPAYELRFKHGSEMPGKDPRPYPISSADSPPFA